MKEFYLRLAGKGDGFSLALALEAAHLVALLQPALVGVLSGKGRDKGKRRGNEARKDMYRTRGVKTCSAAHNTQPRKKHPW